MSLNVLRAVGWALDYVFVMSYDAGDKATTGYDPKVRQRQPFYERGRMPP